MGAGERTRLDLRLNTAQPSAIETGDPEDPCLGVLEALRENLGDLFFLVFLSLVEISVLTVLFGFRQILGVVRCVPWQLRNSLRPSALCDLVSHEVEGRLHGLAVFVGSTSCLLILCCVVSNVGECRFARRSTGSMTNSKSSVLSDEMPGIHSYWTH